jgi:outer membrane lipoprotein-sorting protein
MSSLFNLRGVALLPLLLTFAGSLFAQRSLTPAARDALEQQLRRLPDSTQTIVSDFVQEKEIGVISEKVVSSGRLHFKKPNRIRWEYLEPFPYLVIIQNGRMAVRDGKETNRLDLSSGTFFAEFNALMLDCLQGRVFGSAAYDVSLFETDHGFGAVIRPLKPALARHFSEITLAFDKTVTAVTGLSLKEKGGDVTTIHLKHTSINAPVDDGLFHLD